MRVSSKFCTPDKNVLGMIVLAVCIAAHLIASRGYVSPGGVQCFRAELHSSEGMRGSPDADEQRQCSEPSQLF